MLIAQHGPRNTARG